MAFYMDYTKTDDGGSKFLFFKFTPNVVRHLPPDHLLQHKPNVFYQLSEEMNTVDDLIEGLREKFAIPIEIRIIYEKEDKRLKPRKPIKPLTYGSNNSFRVESAEVGLPTDERARTNVSGMKTFSGESSSKASGRGKRSAETPSPRDFAQAKRQRSSVVTEDHNDSAVKDDAAEETGRRDARNAIQPKLDSSTPGSLTARPLCKGMWSVAEYKEVQPDQIIQLTKQKVPYVSIPRDIPGDWDIYTMTVVEVGRYEIRGKIRGFNGYSEWSQAKREILEIRILQVNEEIFYDVGQTKVSWSLVPYEDVKPGQIVQLNKGPSELIHKMTVVKVDEDVITGYEGYSISSAAKYTIKAIKVMKINGEALYDEEYPVVWLDMKMT